MYPSTGDGTCTFGQVRRVDGRIQHDELEVLTDDVDAFDANNPAVTVREGLLDDHPGLAGLFAPVAGALEPEEVRRLSARVELDGEEPRDVAQDFLRDHGLLAE
ncbi:MAG: glycine betaine ABC transporter substrate-binding protein [Acidimicrobiia bacterium]|nr:glycine betaine ABC transporter substrate-binding protein [Acidimicrobiia bacterium]